MRCLQAVRASGRSVKSASPAGASVGPPGTLTGNLLRCFCSVPSSVSSSCGCFSLCSCFPERSLWSSWEASALALCHSLPEAYHNPHTSFALWPDVLGWEPSACLYFPPPIDDPEDPLQSSLGSPSRPEGGHLPSLRRRKSPALHSQKKSFSPVPPCSPVT